MNSSARVWGYCSAAAVVCVASIPFFRTLLRESVANPYAGHVIFVPILAVFLLWGERHRLRVWTGRGRVAGAALTGAALALLAIGYSTVSLVQQALLFVAAVAGLWLWAYGLHGLRRGWFPLTFLLLMIPPPRGVGSAIAPGVQHVVAVLSRIVLDAVQIPVDQQGVLLRLPQLTLEVAEECAGLRFLPILLILVAAFARIVLSSIPAQVVLTALAIPVAFLANVMRVAVTGAGAYVFGPHVATGPLHYYIGKTLWGLALLVMIGLAWQFRRWSDREVPDGRSYPIAASAP